MIGNAGVFKPLTVLPLGQGRFGFAAEVPIDTALQETEIGELLLQLFDLIAAVALFERFIGVSRIGCLDDAGQFFQQERNDVLICYEQRGEGIIALILFNTVADQIDSVAGKTVVLVKYGREDAAETTGFIGVRVESFLNNGRERRCLPDQPGSVIGDHLPLKVIGVKNDQGDCRTQDTGSKKISGSVGSVDSRKGGFTIERKIGDADGTVECGAAVVIDKAKFHIVFKLFRHDDTHGAPKGVTDGKILREGGKYCHQEQ